MPTLSNVKADRAGFMELVIGPATSGRTRWLSTTLQKQKREQNADRRVFLILRILGMRLALKQSALACRRSTAVLAKESSDSKAQLQAMLPGTWPERSIL